MKRFWIATMFMAALSGLTVGVTQGQEEESSRKKSDSSGQSESRSERFQSSDSDPSRSDEESQSRGERSQREDRSQQQRDREEGRDQRKDDSEIRLRYGDDQGRLSIDIDEDIQFRDDQRRGRRDWATGEEMELRYDIDRNRLHAEGEGTIDVERAANAMARWWQSWWDEEKTARRSQQQGAESGARVFVRQHDENDDNYLSRRELPQNLRSEFDRADRNDDGYLSVSEVRRYGEEMYQTARRRSPSRQETARSLRRDGDDQTWGEWWSSWWSDQDRTNEAPQQITSRGAREFLRMHDRNGDGYLVRSELPDRMYDDFDRIDANDDRYLTRSEIDQYALRTSGDRSERASRTDSRRR